MRKPNALSIAGIDTGGGAGAESDVKAFEMLGVHGLVAVTAITAQNTKGIRSIYPIPANSLREQIRTLKDDFQIDAVKIGMIYERDQFLAVKEEVEELKQVVVDPVLTAKDGTALIRDVEIYRSTIMELPCIVTPNSVEAEALSKVSIRDLESMKRAAETIVNLYGVKAVIIKGGHISGEKSVDLLYDGKDFEYVSYPRVSQRNTHGTGSLFAAALTALLAKGFDLNSSFLKAKEIVYQAILDGLEIGKGIGPVDPVSSLERRAMRFEVIEEMNELAEFIRDSPKFYLLIPEVQSNVAHSIPTPYVRDLCDIATYKGRITRYGDSAVKVNLPAVFCRPTHTARLLFSIIEKGVKANTLMNIRFDPKVVSLFKDMGIDVVEVNRELEPRGEEGKSMQWIVDFLSNTYGKIPGVIYDTGTKGKEAMIRFWASSMEEFKDRIKTLLRGL